MGFSVHIQLAEIVAHFDTNEPLGSRENVETYTRMMGDAVKSLHFALCLEDEAVGDVDTFAIEAGLAEVSAGDDESEDDEPDKGVDVIS